MQALKWDDLVYIGQQFCKNAGEGTALSAVLFCSCWAQVKIDGKKRGGSQEEGGKSFA